MKRRFPSAIVLAVLAVLILSGLPDSASAEFNVNINIGTPPVVVVEPAAVVLIPRIGVYFVPDGDADLFFYAGFWWSPRGDRWYRSQVCNGPWVVVEQRIVPMNVIRVPRNYRVQYVKAKHVPYGQWKKAHGKHDGKHERGKHGGKHGNHND